MKYFLSSGDSYQFKEPREIDVIRKVTIGEKKKEGIIIKINPVVIGQNFGLGGEDIEYLVLTPRHQNVTISPIGEFPCFVYIIRIVSNKLPQQDFLLKEDVQIIAWGEIYKTLNDAKNYLHSLNAK